MCGIAGILRFGSTDADPSEIERMTRAIAHRGPDGEGFLRRDGVALGHRRLAIIDLEAGRQPMSNEDGSVWITFNGEIYNFRELTDELTARGHRFATRSDTEVIVHAYEEWGSGCLERLRGMFAFAIADFDRRRLFLARDHFGIKPLYYRRSGGLFAFASEIGALRQIDAPTPDLGLEAIDLFLRFQYVPAPGTIYADTWKLPPASWMTVDFDGTVREPQRYWDLRFDPTGPRDADEMEQLTERVIRDSVEKHLVADVPFGVFLSGGIDSTLVAMEMAKILDTKVRAFGIGFDEQEYSELGYARTAAERTGVELITDVVREEEAAAILPDLVAHYGEPHGDTSAIPTWFVSRLAREHVPMVLSGDGGDEAFAGYDSYRQWMKLPRVAQSIELLRGGHVGGAMRSLVGAMRRRGSGATLAGEWQRQITYVDDASRRAIWREPYRELAASACNSFEEAAQRAEGFDHMAFAQYLDYQTYLPNDILTKVDVASMYHGLEVRTPLIDRVVVEHAARVPLELRYRRNAEGHAVGKYLLKRILQREFPESFVHRRKMGFAPPRAHWFLPGHHFRRLAEELLLPEDGRIGALFDRDLLRRQLETHALDRDNSGRLWLFLVLALWLEQSPVAATIGGVHAR